MHNRQIDQPQGVLTVTLADLRMRCRQFAIAVVGATLVFAMALVMAGLSGGFRAEAARTAAAVRADGFVVQTGGGGPFTTAADLPGALLGRVRHVPGVTAADPLVVATTLSFRMGTAQVLAHMIGARPGGMGAPRVQEGRGLRRTGDAVADTMTHLHLGDVITAGPRRLTVVGLVSGMSYFAGTPSVYVTLADARAVVFGGRPDMTSIAIRGNPSALPAGLALMSTYDARADMLTPLRNGLRSIDLVRDFLWLVAVVIIGAVVYLSALERRRDFAVLKAIGSSTRWLYSGMAMQAAVMALLSGVLAIAIEPLLATMLPMELSVPLQARAVLPVVALGIGFCSSLAGLRQVLRADPALAFGSN